MEYNKNLSLELLTGYDDDGNFHIEEFRDIKGCEKYCQVSSFGRVKSLKRLTTNGRQRQETIRKLTLEPRGYMNVGLHINGKTSIVSVHRLVAKTFIPNPDNKPDVNHKNLLKTNNMVWNLEWTTERENVVHYYMTQTTSSSKYIGVYWDKVNEKWETEITYKGKKVYKKRFDDELEAHESRQKKLKELGFV